VHGFKPTAGLVPTTGHFPRVGPRSDGRTQIGPLSGSIDLIERVLATIAGPDHRDSGVAPVALAPADLTRLRFAVLTGEAGLSTSTELAQAVEQAAAALSSRGLERVEWKGPWLSDALDITQRYWARTDLSGNEADRQLRDWDRFCRKYLETAKNVELLLTPVTTEVAPAHRKLDGGDFVFTLPASLTGSPAMSVAAGVGGDGMPLAVQVIGPPWQDLRVLAAARLLSASSTPGGQAF
jgi:amidase